MQTTRAKEKLETIRWSNVEIDPREEEGGSYTHRYIMICSDCGHITVEDVDVGIPTGDHPPLVLSAIRCVDCGLWSAVPFNRDALDLLDTRVAGCGRVGEDLPGS